MYTYIHIHVYTQKLYIHTGTRCRHWVQWWGKRVGTSSNYRQTDRYTRRSSSMSFCCFIPARTHSIEITFYVFLLLYTRRWSSMSKVVFFPRLHKIFYKEHILYRTHSIPTDRRLYLSAALTALFGFGCRGPRLSLEGERERERERESKSR